MIMRFLIFVLILSTLAIIGVFHLKDAFPMMIAQDRYTFISATIVACSILCIFAAARFIVLLTEYQASFDSRSVIQPKSRATYSSSSSSSHRSAIQSHNSSSSSNDHLLIHAALLTSYGDSSNSNDTDTCHDTTSPASFDSSCSGSSD